MSKYGVIVLATVFSFKLWSATTIVTVISFGDLLNRTVPVITIASVAFYSYCCKCKVLEVFINVITI